MGRTRAWIVLALCVFLKAAHVEAETLKVLQFNFNSETVLEDKDYRFRDRRLPLIVEWIKRNDPDIVMFDEGWNYHHAGSVIRLIAEAVGYDYDYRIGMGFPGLLYDSDGIIAKKRFKMSHRHFTKLPHGAPWFGDGQNWIVVLGAISWNVGAELTLEDGSPLYVYSTHLIGKTQADRDDQIWGVDRAIRGHLERAHQSLETARILIGGDFNSGPQSGGFRKMLANGYHDTFGEAHPGVDICTNCMDPEARDFNPMTLAAGQFPAQDKPDVSDRIDHVLTRGPGMRTLASTLVFTAPLDRLWMSDHYGVFSTIQVGDGPSEGSPTVANPLRDREDLGVAGQVVHVTDSMLSCRGTGRRWCELPWLGEVSWEHGMTFINDSRFNIHLDVRPRVPGVGRVWAEQQISLKPGRVSAFFFEPGNGYEFLIQGAGNQVTGTFESDMRAEQPSFLAWPELQKQDGPQAILPRA